MTKLWLISVFDGTRHWMIQREFRYVVGRELGKENCTKVWCINDFLTLALLVCGLLKLFDA